MIKSILAGILFFSFLVPVIAQTGNDSIKDPLLRTYRFSNPNTDISPEPYLECGIAEIMFLSDSSVTDTVFLRTNFTDPFLQVCTNLTMYPASRTWGFNMQHRYFRSMDRGGSRYIFAESIMHGKLNLYYHLNIPSTPGPKELITGDPAKPDYRNRILIEEKSKRKKKPDYIYFVSPSMDSSLVIPVNEKSLKSFAKQHLVNCPPAYTGAMKFHNQYRVIQNIMLPVAICSYIVSFLTPKGGGVDAFNYQSPFLYVSFASLGTFIYYRIKANKKVLDPDKMNSIINDYNQY